jgi:hypothetical protein
VSTLERIRKTALRARELAAEFRTDIPLRDALMAYAAEVDVQVREYLCSGRAGLQDEDLALDENLSEAVSPSQYWHRECAFLREQMLSLMPGDGRRRTLMRLADECARLGDLMESRTR